MEILHPLFFPQNNYNKNEHTYSKISLCLSFTLLFALSVSHSLFFVRSLDHSLLISPVYIISLTPSYSLYLTHSISDTYRHYLFHKHIYFPITHTLSLKYTWFICHTQSISFNYSFPRSLSLLFFMWNISSSKDSSHCYLRFLHTSPSQTFVILYRLEYEFIYNPKVIQKILFYLKQELFPFRTVLKTFYLEEQIFFPITRRIGPRYLPFPTLGESIIDCKTKVDTFIVI